MIDKKIVLDIVKNLLKDKKALANPNIDVVIYSLLRPYVGRRKIINTNYPKEIGLILDKTIQEHGYCTNCRDKKLENKTDSTCASCKRALKNLCKKKLEDDFYSL